MARGRLAFDSMVRPDAKAPHEAALVRADCVRTRPRSCAIPIGAASERTAEHRSRLRSRQCVLTLWDPSPICAFGARQRLRRTKNQCSGARADQSRMLTDGRHMRGCIRSSTTGKFASSEPPRVASSARRGALRMTTIPSAFRHSQPRAHKWWRRNHEVKGRNLTRKKALPALRADFRSVWRRRSRATLIKTSSAP